MKLYGYRCPTCGRKVLHDALIDVEDDLVCPNCGDRMVGTTIPKQKTKEPDEPSEVVTVKKPKPDGCKNCCFSRRNNFESNGEAIPGFKCRKDGRTHSPDACCVHHRRRGRVMKSRQPTGGLDDENMGL